MALPTRLWVQAYVARFSAQGKSVFVLRRGDPHRGVVLVKLHLLGEGFRVMAQRRNLEGDLAWESVLGEAPAPEAEADGFIERQAGYDPDLWVIEVEMRSDDAELDQLFSGPVV
jgi:hypothetical protein